jgi:ribonuclease HI
METRRPHYLLYSQTNTRQQPGSWKVVLKTDDGKVLLEAGDSEPDVQGERLELLAVVRGLEALDRPARVTLATPSRYVRRGLTYGLEEWRANGWSWEWFGRMVPIKNRDLWQRLDRALKFHDVECRYWRVDGPHEWLKRPQPEQSTALTPQLVRANSFDRATAEAALDRVEHQKSRRNSPNCSKAPSRPRSVPADTRHGWLSTFIRTLGLLLMRVSGDPALAPAGRFAPRCRE